MNPKYLIRDLQGNEIQCNVNDEFPWNSKFNSEEEARSTIKLAKDFLVNGQKRTTIEYEIVEFYEHSV